MTVEAQRIAIAESLGFIQRTEGLWWNDKEHRAYIMQGSVLHGVRKTMNLPCDNGVMLPDWLGDLNAAHALEATLDDAKDGQCRAYADLFENMGPCKRSRFGMIHAFAGERAENYLRVIGRWEESP